MWSAPPATRSPTACTSWIPMATRSSYTSMYSPRSGATTRPPSIRGSSHCTSSRLTRRALVGGERRPCLICIGRLSPGSRWRRARTARPVQRLSFTGEEGLAPVRRRGPAHLRAGRCLQPIRLRARPPRGDSSLRPPEPGPAPPTAGAGSRWLTQLSSDTEITAPALAGCRSSGERHPRPDLSCGRHPQPWPSGSCLRQLPEPH